MERQTNFHPVYTSGQYLTSEHLNETHNFLWQEEKATRYALTGNGIASGLDADFTSSSGRLQAITITKGAASTIDGYLVSPTGNLSFGKAAPVTLVWYTTTDGASHLMYKIDFEKVKDSLNLTGSADINTFEFVGDAVPQNEQPDGTQSLNSFGLLVDNVWSSYIVLCWVYNKDKQNNQCEQGDCNTKGSQRNYSAKFFLVKNTDIPEQNTIGAELPTCSVARIKNLSTASSIAGMVAKSFEAWSAGFGELSPYFTGAQASKHLQKVAGLLGDADQTRFTNSVATFNNINTGVNVQNCPQYYAAFASDLSKAINELVVFYNDYVAKFIVMKPDRIEGIILLGSLRRQGIDKWRYYFQPAAGLLEGQLDKLKLKRLFIRVLAMVENFITQEAINSKANAVAGRPLAIPSVTNGALLQNAAIPYYFDIAAPDNDLLKLWNPSGGGLGNVYCYYDSLTPGRNDMGAKMRATSWADQNFFRMEGHIGMPKAAALAALTNLINSDGLPIQVIDCDVNYKGPVEWVDWYKKFMGNIVSWTANLKEEAFRKKYVYDYSPIKKIQEEITQTSFRDMDKVAKLYNDFTAYSGVFYNAATKPAVAAGKAAKSVRAAAKSSISTDVIKSYTQVVDQGLVAQLATDYKKAIASQGEATKQKLIILSDLIGLEYMGGTVRGGTFVLLHDGTKVIGDGSLPYYYKINGTRVFNE